MSNSTLKLIVSFLEENNVSFVHLTHEHVHHSEDAAKIRGNVIEDAAKAIILKVKEKSSKEYRIIQCVLCGHKRIDLKKLKVALNLQSASLASPEEVLEKTGCTIGSVPPFGKLLGIEMYVDSSIKDREFIFFSAGTHNDSIKMKSFDFLKILNVTVLEVS
ncbi:MAG: YbaK/EbsC family protein [Candidatus Woesearchaeota archaeon]|jgi:Ala-tRNA(Pro) deacylase